MKVVIKKILREGSLNEDISLEDQQIMAVIDFRKILREVQIFETKLYKVWDENNRDEELSC